MSSMILSLPIAGSVPLRACSAEPRTMGISSPGYLFMV